MFTGHYKAKKWPVKFFFAEIVFPSTFVGVAGAKRCPLWAPKAPNGHTGEERTAVPQRSGTLSGTERASIDLVVADPP